MLRHRWIALILPFLFLYFSPKPLQKEAVVKYVIGEVEAQSRNQTSWRNLKINNTLIEGDRIKTALNSRVELTMPDGTILKINQNTIFDLDEIKVPSEDQEDKMSFTVWAGNIWAKFTKLVSPRQERKVESPGAVVAIRGTTIEMNVDMDQNTRVRVEEGTVVVNSKDAEGEVTVSANQETFIARGKAPTQPSSFQGQSDTDETEKFMFNVNLKSPIITDPSVLVAGLQLSGWVPKGSQLAANQMPVQVGFDGTFNTRVRVKEGLNRIEMTAKHGSRSETRELKVFVNTKRPEIRLSTPLVAAFYNRRDYQLSGSVFDVTPGDKIVVYINDEQVVEVIGRGSFNRTIILNEGKNDIRVAAKDRSANTTEISQQLFLDTVKPILTVTQPPQQIHYRFEPPAPPNVKNVRKEQEVRGIIIDPQPSSGLKRVSLNGKELKPRSDGSFVTNIPLIRGDNRLNFEIEDMAGNIYRDNTRMVRVPK
jgi:nitrogen fixation protein FixH